MDHAGTGDALRPLRTPYDNTNEKHSSYEHSNFSVSFEKTTARLSNRSAWNELLSANQPAQSKSQLLP